MQKKSVLMGTNVPGYPVYNGKCRDCYKLGEKTLLLCTDRISARDAIFPNGIPGKGRALTGDTVFWLRTLEGVTVPHHLISTELKDCPAEFQRSEFEGRVMLCHTSREELGAECIVRGYMYGSLFKEYEKVCKEQPGDGPVVVNGASFERGIKLAEELPEPIFTPSTKAKTGHDVNISFQKMCEIVGHDRAETMRRRALEIYKRGRRFAIARSIILGDTKMEFGVNDDGDIMLIDELLTVDSSRAWPKSKYVVGQRQVGWDKEPPRLFLDKELADGRWDGNPKTCPALPEPVVEQMAAIYAEFHTLLTGQNDAA